jgi:DNA adenine methylase
MNVTRPFMRYHGSKWAIAPWVIEHFPAHRVYVEPFGGAAAVMLRKPPSPSEIWNDLNSDLFNVFSVLRDADARERLVEALALTPFHRDEYELLYAKGGDAVERARRFIARSFMGYGSKGAEQKSGFDSRLNDDGYCSRLRSLRAGTAGLAAIAERFADVLLENRPARLVIDAYDRPDTLFFVDPPYLHETHGSARIYRHDMSEAEHRALLARLRSVTGFVVLAGYASQLYDEALPGWRRVHTQARADGGRKREETLWLSPSIQAAHGPLFSEAAP